MPASPINNDGAPADAPPADVAADAPNIDAPRTDVAGDLTGDAAVDAGRDVNLGAV